MEKEQLEMYAPTNARNLSEEQLAAMEHFTKDDLKQLAQAYPNNSQMNAYLILHERGVAANKQVGHPSTWNNLYQLVKMGSTKYYAISFRSIYKAKPVGGSATSKPVQKARDITNEEAKEKLTGVKQQAKQVEGEGKTAAQIAEEEGKNLGSSTPAKPEKPLAKMNLTELVEKYKEVFDGEEPEEDSTKKQLIAAIESKM